MVGDASDDVGEPSLGIDAVEAGGLNEGVHDGGSAAAVVRRDVMMPGVWVVRPSSSILSIRYSRSRRLWSPIGRMAALAI
jgi:hypothetical protein